jgi:hypothetical protein
VPCESWAQQPSLRRKPSCAIPANEIPPFLRTNCWGKDNMWDLSGASACVMLWGARLGRLRPSEIDEAVLDVDANQFDAELVADIEALSALCQ